MDGAVQQKCSLGLKLPPPSCHCPLLPMPNHPSTHLQDNFLLARSTASQITALIWSLSKPPPFPSRCHHMPNHPSTHLQDDFLLAFSTASQITALIWSLSQ